MDVRTLHNSALAFVKSPPTDRAQLQHCISILSQLIENFSSKYKTPYDVHKMASSIGTNLFNAKRPALSRSLARFMRTHLAQMKLKAEEKKKSNEKQPRDEEETNHTSTNEETNHTSTNEETNHTSTNEETRFLLLLQFEALELYSSCQLKQNAFLSSFLEKMKSDKNIDDGEIEEEDVLLDIDEIVENMERVQRRYQQISSSSTPNNSDNKTTIIWKSLQSAVPSICALLRIMVPKFPLATTASSPENHSSNATNASSHVKKMSEDLCKLHRALLHFLESCTRWIENFMSLQSHLMNCALSCIQYGWGHLKRIVDTRQQTALRCLGITSASDIKEKYLSASTQGSYSHSHLLLNIEESELQALESVAGIHKEEDSNNNDDNQVLLLYQLQWVIAGVKLLDVMDNRNKSWKSESEEEVGRRKGIDFKVSRSMKQSDSILTILQHCLSMAYDVHVGMQQADIHLYDDCKNGRAKQKECIPPLSSNSSASFSHQRENLKEWQSIMETLFDYLIHYTVDRLEGQEVEEGENGANDISIPTLTLTHSDISLVKNSGMMKQNMSNKEIDGDADEKVGTGFLLSSLLDLMSMRLWHNFITLVGNGGKSSVAADLVDLVNGIPLSENGKHHIFQQLFHFFSLLAEVQQERRLADKDEKNGEESIFAKFRESFSSLSTSILEINTCSKSSTCWLLIQLVFTSQCSQWKLHSTVISTLLAPIHAMCSSNTTQHPPKICFGVSLACALTTLLSMHLSSIGDAPTAHSYVFCPLIYALSAGKCFSRSNLQCALMALRCYQQRIVSTVVVEEKDELNTGENINEDWRGMKKVLTVCNRHVLQGLFPSSTSTSLSTVESIEKHPSWPHFSFPGKSTAKTQKIHCDEIDSLSQKSPSSIQSGCLTMDKLRDEASTYILQHDRQCSTTSAVLTAVPNSHFSALYRSTSSLYPSEAGELFPDFTLALHPSVSREKLANVLLAGKQCIVQLFLSAGGKYLFLHRVESAEEEDSENVACSNVMVALPLVLDREEGKKDDGGNGADSNSNILQLLLNEMQSITLAAAAHSKGMGDTIRTVENDKKKKKDKAKKGVEEGKEDDVPVYSKSERRAIKEDWWEKRAEFDQQVKSVVFRMQKQLFGSWRGMLLGSPLDKILCHALQQLANELADKVEHWAQEFILPLENSTKNGDGEAVNAGNDVKTTIRGRQNSTHDHSKRAPSSSQGKTKKGASTTNRVPLKRSASKSKPMAKQPQHLDPNQNAIAAEEKQKMSKKSSPKSGPSPTNASSTMDLSMDRKLVYLLLSSLFWSSDRICERGSCGVGTRQDGKGACLFTVEGEEECLDSLEQGLLQLLQGGSSSMGCGEGRRKLHEITATAIQDTLQLFYLAMDRRNQEETLMNVSANEEEESPIWSGPQDYLALPRQHIFLVIDDTLHGFPWEATPVLQQQSVSRIPSVYFLMEAMSQKHRRYKNWEQEVEDSKRQRGNSSSFRAHLLQSGVNINCGLYVLNPSGDMQRSEKTFLPLLDQLQCRHQLHGDDQFNNHTSYNQHPINGEESWTGLVQCLMRGATEGEVEFKEKKDRNLTTIYKALATRDVYLYIGHNSGERLVHRNVLYHGGVPNKVDYTPIRSVVMLMGCSSLKLETASTNCHSGKKNEETKVLKSSAFIPYGMPYAYLLAGSPLVIGCLWDITDGDIDRLTEGILTSILELPTATGYQQKRPYLACDEDMGKKENTEISYFQTPPPRYAGLHHSSSEKKQGFHREGLHSALRNLSLNEGAKDTQGHDPSPCQKHDCDENSQSPIMRQGGVSIVSAVLHARAQCKFKYLTGAATVCYGVPVSTSNPTKK